jgi:hypothetical protein
MRTKSLFIAAAALVAGLVSVQAQSNVYSLNVVGYVNEIYKGNGAFTLCGNPLDDGNGNQLTNLFASLPKGSSVQVWNGAGYVLSTKGATTWATNFTIPPGTGFFVKPGSVANITNTFVGTVNNLTATNTLISNVTMLVCSPLPIGGDLTNGPTGSTNFNLGNSLLKGAIVQVWDNSGPGTFVLSTKGTTTWATNLTFAVGQGFFVKSTRTTNWVQTITLP